MVETAQQRTLKGEWPTCTWFIFRPITRNLYAIPTFTAHGTSTGLQTNLLDPNSRVCDLATIQTLITHLLWSPKTRLRSDHM